MNDEYVAWIRHFQELFKQGLINDLVITVDYEREVVDVFFKPLKAAECIHIDLVKIVEYDIG